MPVLSFSPCVLTMLYLYLVKSLVILKTQLSTHLRKKKILENVPYIWAPCSLIGMKVFLSFVDTVEVKELGRLNQFMIISITHLTPLLKKVDSFRAMPIRYEIQHNHRTPSIAVMVWKALNFNWSAFSYSLPLSPSLGRIRTQRTERLQKVMINIAKTTQHKIRINVLLADKTLYTPINPKHCFVLKQHKTMTPTCLGANI